MNLEDELTYRGPCFWCGYNGAGFYDVHTHEKYCPWYNVEGWEARQEKLLDIISGLWDLRKGFVTLPHDEEPRL